MEKPYQQKKTQEEKIENGITQGLTKALGPLLVGLGALATAVNPLTLAVMANTAALMRSTGVSGIGGLLGGPGGGMLRGVLGLGGVGVGIGGATLGRNLVDQGYKKTGIGVGALGGGIGAAMLALALAPATGGLSLAAIAGLGALAGGTYAGFGKPVGDIAMGPGAGKVILGPQGAFRLNSKMHLLPEPTWQHLLMKK